MGFRATRGEPRLEEAEDGLKGWRALPVVAFMLLWDNLSFFLDAPKGGVVGVGGRRFCC